jgi:hypothetical protein
VVPAARARLSRRRAARTVRPSSAGCAAARGWCTPGSALDPRVGHGCIEASVARIEGRSGIGDQGIEHIVGHVVGHVVRRRVVRHDDEHVVRRRVVVDTRGRVVDERRIGRQEEDGLAPGQREENDEGGSA